VSGREKADRQDPNVPRGCSSTRPGRRLGSRVGGPACSKRQPPCHGAWNCGFWPSLPCVSLRSSVAHSGLRWRSSAFDVRIRRPRYSRRPGTRARQLAL